MNTTACLSDFLDGYNIICNDLDKECVQYSLKRHYADGCCAGDYVMKQVLKQLFEGTATPDSLLILSKEWEEEDLFSTVLDNLMDTLQYWWRRGECEPNAWWAS